tara:strand:- start:27621 stop:28049 length:429 start_codon:yes stop_codon:yes gene_type:complete
MDQAIVTPLDYLLGPENIGGQASVARQGGITILGVSASFIATASNGWLQLNALDSVYVPDVASDFPIWELHSPANTAAQQSVNCAWSLSPANYRSSPQASGAILEVKTANIDSGFITVWGIFGQSPIGGIKAFSGSPADFNS